MPPYSRSNSRRHCSPSGSPENSSWIRWNDSGLSVTRPLCRAANTRSASSGSSIGMSRLHRQHQITFITFLPPGTSQPRSREAVDAVGGASASALGPSAKPPVQSGLFGAASSVLPSDFLAVHHESQLGVFRLSRHVQDHLGIESASVSDEPRITPNVLSRPRSPRLAPRSVGTLVQHSGNVLPEYFRRSEERRVGKEGRDRGQAC